MAPILTRSASRIVRAISSILPRHTKRLVLWSVLYTRLHGKRVMSKEQCERLNQILTLCEDKDALALPAQLGVFIWSDLDDCSMATNKAIRGEKTIEASASEFIRSIPKFLRYASDALMLKDFQSLLSFYVEQRHQREVAY